MAPAAALSSDSTVTGSASPLREALLSLLEEVLQETPHASLDALPTVLERMYDLCLERREKDALARAEASQQAADDAAKARMHAEQVARAEQAEKAKLAELEAAAAEKEASEARAIEEEFKAAEEEAKAAAKAAEEEAKAAAKAAKLQAKQTKAQSKADSKARKLANEARRAAEKAAAKAEVASVALMEKERKAAERELANLEAAGEKQRAGAEARKASAAREEEKAAKEATAAAQAVAAARKDATEAAAEAARSLEIAEIEAGAAASNEEMRTAMKARERAVSAQKEAEKAAAALQKAEEKAQKAAERHRHSSETKAAAAMEAARVALSVTESLQQEREAVEGRRGRLGSSGGAGGGVGRSAASTLASKRLLRASDRLKRLSAGGEEQSGESDADEIIYKGSAEGWNSGGAARAVASEQLERAATLLCEEGGGEAGALDGEGGGEEQSAEEVPEEGWLAEWRRGGVQRAVLDGHMLVQSDCIVWAGGGSGGGSRFVSIGGDGADDGLSLSILDGVRGAVGSTQHLRGHTDKVLSVACEGDLVASGSRDQTIRLWSLREGACMATLTECEGPVFGLALQGELLLSGEGDAKSAKARLWRTKDGGRDGAACAAVFSGHRGNIWSVALGSLPSEGGAAEGLRVVGVSACHDRNARIWPTDGRTTALATLKHPNWVVSASTSPSGGAPLLATGCADANARLWSLESPYTCLSVINHGGGDELSGINWISVHLHASALLTGGQDGRIQVWAHASGNGKAERLVTMTHGESAVRGLAASSRLGQIASAGGRSVSLWQAAPVGAALEPIEGRQGARQRRASFTQPVKLELMNPDSWLGAL
jgi:WD40 repeat protein